MKNSLIFFAVLVIFGFMCINFFTGYRAISLSAFETPDDSSALALTNAIIEHGKQTSGE